jgi:glutamate/tyrosine decarboxylase-like PLP-dependent enzyme
MNVSEEELTNIFKRITNLAILRFKKIHELNTFPEIDEKVNLNELINKDKNLTEVIDHIFDDILPNLSNSAGPNWFGLVTGGVLPASLIGDWLTTLYDQNVIQNISSESIAGILEIHTLNLLLDLFNLPRDYYLGKTFTTGATSSNILGLLCGRQWIMLKKWGINFAEDGYILNKIIKVIHVKSHFSIIKAASIIGIGKKNCLEINNPSNLLEFNLKELENLLITYKQNNNIGAIIVIGFGEVNTGNFTNQLPYIRKLCDKYDAWLHVDAAFGIMSRISPIYNSLSKNLELSDSITADAHKWLNVPYDCGIFFCKYLDVLEESFGNLNPAYINKSNNLNKISQPFSINIESSRRFRALPLYINLQTYGIDGYRSIVENNCKFAKDIHNWLYLNNNLYTVLTPCVLNIVLFCASSNTKFFGKEGNDLLLEKINNSKKIYVSKTIWNNTHALRIAICNWQTPFKGQLENVIDVLQNIIIS